MRTVLYLRLSDEDRNKLSSDEVSESIKNQETILRNYAESQNWEIIGVYDDEDYSGADRDRPNFNKMLKECELGNVDIVLVKTQARFARDIELIDKYVHNKFYEWNVRFMTYIEKIDNTKKETKKTSQIMGMIDEWYVEDTSINIRETLKSKRENGEFTGSFAVYGYNKDPENKNHLIVDPIAAYTVERIYKEYLLGNGLQRIADELNKENILSPLEYKKLNGSKLQIPFTKNFENYQSIKTSGTFKIDISYQNNHNTELQNLYFYHYLTKDKKNFDSKCNISLKTYDIKKANLFYTTNKDIFYSEDWINMNAEEQFPQNITCIIASIPILNKNELIQYQFEITLKENKKKEEFFFLINTYIGGKKKNIFPKIKIRKKYKWSSQTIRKILKDETYIGNLVQFKSTTVNYKNHTIIHNDKSKQIKTTNTHEPIIGKEDWIRVQKRLLKKSRSTKTGTLNPFSNKVICKYCNSIFSKCGKQNKKGFGYLCCKDKKRQWQNCINKTYLNEEELTKLILKKLNELGKKLYDKNLYFKQFEKNRKKTSNNNPIEIIKEELEKLNKELQKRKNYFVKLYDNFIEGILSKEEFVILKTRYQDSNNKIKDRIFNLEKELQKQKRSKEKSGKEEIIPTNFIKFNKLNNDLINTFVEKIIIGCYDFKNNTREINIIWNFTQ